MAASRASISALVSHRSPTTMPIFIWVGSAEPLSAATTSSSDWFSSFGIDAEFGRSLPSRPMRITAMIPLCWCSSFSPYVRGKCADNIFKTS